MLISLITQTEALNEKVKMLENKNKILGQNNKMLQNEVELRRFEISTTTYSKRWKRGLQDEDQVMDLFLLKFVTFIYYPFTKSCLLLITMSNYCTYPNLCLGKTIV